MSLVFQLTTSQGGRRTSEKIKSIMDYISTHDLARRSTLAIVRDEQVCYYFNSRPHKEVDTQKIDVQRQTITFQLTTSRRGRPDASFIFAQYSSFQLTTSRRGRREKNTAMTEWNPFQLTTSRGDRLEPTSLPLAMCDHFNSRPHE